MRSTILLIVVILGQLAGGCAAPPASEAVWQQHVKPNAAWRRAKQRPAFSMADPAGFVTSEAEKEQQRRAGETLRAARAAARDRGDRELVFPPGQYRFGYNWWLVLDGAADRRPGSRYRPPPRFLTCRAA